MVIFCKLPSPAGCIINAQSKHSSDHVNVVGEGGKSLRLFYLCQIKKQTNRFFSLTLKPHLNLSPITILSYLHYFCQELQELHKLVTPYAPVLSFSVLLLKYSFCLKYLLPHFRYPVLPVTASLSNATLFEKPLWPQKEPVSYSTAAFCLNLSQDTSLHMGSYQSSNRQIALKLRGGNNFK